MKNKTFIQSFYVIKKKSVFNNITKRCYKKGIKKLFALRVENICNIYVSIESD